METWVTSYRRKKWKWANHVANLSVGRPARATAEWRADLSSKKGRLAAHPMSRWADRLDQILQMHHVSLPWHEAARDSELWNRLEEAFVSDPEE